MFHATPLRRNVFFQYYTSPVDEERSVHIVLGDFVLSH